MPTPALMRALLLLAAHDPSSISAVIRSIQFSYQFNKKRTAVRML